MLIAAGMFARSACPLAEAMRCDASWNKRCCARSKVKASAGSTANSWATSMAPNRAFISEPRVADWTRFRSPTKASWFSFRSGCLPLRPLLCFAVRWRGLALFGIPIGSNSESSISSSARAGDSASGTFVFALAPIGSVSNFTSSASSSASSAASSGASSAASAMASSAASSAASSSGAGTASPAASSSQMASAATNCGRRELAANTVYDTASAVACIRHAGAGSSTEATAKASCTGCSTRIRSRGRCLMYRIEGTPLRLP
mmetsp:Transcript_91837/g.264254  ORF Transcript_91837/g.264254 Transcript_91837/m.264254 type:complete len:261 (+) Transcript_91837:357-1139(+)